MTPITAYMRIMEKVGKPLTFISLPAVPVRWYITPLTGELALTNPSFDWIGN